MFYFLRRWLDDYRREREKRMLKKMLVRQDRLDPGRFEVMSYSVLNDRPDGQSMVCGLLLLRDGRMVAFDGSAGRKERPMVIGDEDLPYKMKEQMKKTPDYTRAARRLGLRG